MDGIDYLNQTRPAPDPVNLMGLSPAEIQGVSAGRARTDQKMFQMLGLMMDKKRMESTLQTQKAARDLSERRRQKLDEPMDTQEMEIEGKKYRIPTTDIVDGLRLMKQFKRDEKLNLLTDEQTASAGIRIPTKIEVPKGTEGAEEVDGHSYKNYDLSQTHVKAIVEAGKLRKQEEERSTAMAALKNVAPAEMMEKENFNNLLIANPSAAAALMNKVTPEGASGLSDAQYRYYADTNVSLIQAVLKRKNPDDTLINTANNLSRKLKDPHMLLKIKDTGWFSVPGSTKAVTVSLPPNVTADMVFEEAEKRGISVEEILQTIYDKTK